jgi:polar amino acid transport system substrate-binding protein
MTKVRWLVALFSLLALVRPGIGAEASCALTLGWEPYAPYSYLDDQGELTGADVELVKTLADAIGCTLSFKPLPWARHLRELEAGLTDVAASARRSEERDAYSWPSVSYRRNQMALYVRRGETGKHKLDRLASIPEVGFRLGIITDYYYGPGFATLKADPQFARYVDEAVDYQTNIRKLIHKRIDGVLVDDVDVMMAEVERLGLRERLELHPVLIPGATLHLLFSKKSVDRSIVAAVNDILVEMETDGRLQQLLNKFVKQVDAGSTH